MLAWTKQNTMQRAMRTVLEWPQSHATRKTINMITNKYEPQQKCRLGTVSKILLGDLTSLSVPNIALSFYHGSKHTVVRSAWKSFPNRWSFSYLKFTKYVINIIAKPKYKYRHQEQVTVRNHNRSTALERSV